MNDNCLFSLVSSALYKAVHDNYHIKRESLSWRRRRDSNQAFDNSMHIENQANNNNAFIQQANSNNSETSFP
jgi:hypothetical protein